MTKKLTFIKVIIITFLLLNVYSVAAQKPVLTDEEVVIETVTKEIDDVFVSKEFLNKKNKKFTDIKGTMVVDIGIVQNGKVSSFFKVESDIK
ncbi:MAG TPA: hypothetical protein PLC36_03605, partial [Flavobacterium sp.]|nr:hypothetical protein [Flavobacterium sp.]